MLNVTHQGAAREAASVHFRPSIARIDIGLVVILMSAMYMSHNGSELWRSLSSRLVNLFSKQRVSWGGFHSRQNFEI